MVLEAMAEVQDIQPAAMAILMMSKPAEQVVRGRLMGDFSEADATALDLGVLALEVASVVREDCLELVVLVRAEAEARPMSVWEGDLVEALV